jgi:RNA recognition motif-containing protein
MKRSFGLIQRFSSLTTTLPLKSVSGASHNTFNGTSIQKRFINQCLHIKGLPVHLSKTDLYSFMKDYGTIEELATYPEAPKFNNNDPESSSTKRKNFITHDRKPGQTAIVKFQNVKSAIMCKEELHWRPFPCEMYELTDEIIETNPRSRPLVNILFETDILFERLRPWVKRDLAQSRRMIAKTDGRSFEFEKKNYGKHNARGAPSAPKSPIYKK